MVTSNNLLIRQFRPSKNVSRDATQLNSPASHRQFCSTEIRHRMAREYLYWSRGKCSFKSQIGNIHRACMLNVSRLSVAIIYMLDESQNISVRFWYQVISAVRMLSEPTSFSKLICRQSYNSSCVILIVPYSWLVLLVVATHNEWAWVISLERAPWDSCFFARARAIWAFSSHSARDRARPAGRSAQVSPDWRAFTRWTDREVPVSPGLSLKVGGI